ncbi:MAG TPA: FecR family protein [Bacteroidales bacterium]
MDGKIDLEIEIISRCISGIATEQEKQRVLSWINENKENESVYFKMKDLYEAGSMHKLKKEADTAHEWSKLKARIENSDRIETKRRRTYNLAPLLKYAAILLIGAFSTIIAERLFKVYNYQENINSANTILTGKSERSQLILPDGTKVWLNVCSSISYNQSYGSKVREVMLNGEAYFKVTKNPKVPFIVKAGGYNIRALGTAFNVSAYIGDNQVSAVLEEGSISFGKENMPEPQVIKPGQRICYSGLSDKLTIENVDTRLYTAWRDGEYRFEQLEFGQIAKRLGQFYNVTFVFRNEKIRNIPFTGTFKSSESIIQVLNVIQTNTQMKYKFRNDTVFIR